VNLGFSLAPVIAGLLAGRGFSLVVLFVGDAATTAIFGLLVVATVKETRAPTAREAPRPSLWTPYADRTFLAFAAVSSLIALVFFQGHVALPVDMRAHGLSPREFGLLIAINGALIVVLQPFALPVVSKLPRGVALGASAVLYGIGFGMNGIAAGSVPIYAASIAVWTLGEIVNAPITPAVVADLAPPELRGSYQGAFQITFGAASFVGPALGSLVLGRWGSGVLWGGTLVVGLAAAAGFVAVDRAAVRRRPA
jgi:MFS family permease